MGTELKWFGMGWNAPVNHLFEAVPTPVGQPCGECGNPIEFGDRGYLVPELGGTSFPWHQVCFLTMMLGPNDANVIEAAEAQRELKLAFVRGSDLEELRTILEG